MYFNKKNIDDIKINTNFENIKKILKNYIKNIFLRHFYLKIDIYNLSYLIIISFKSIKKYKFYKCIF